MKKEKTAGAGKSFIIVILIGVVMAVFSALTCYEIRRIMEDSCYRILRESAEQGASDARLMLAAGESQTEMVADLLASGGTLDAGTCRSYLTTITANNLMDSYAVLLPGGEMIYKDTDEQITGVAFDFETEAEKAPYFITRLTDTSGNDYAACVSPVVQDGETVGVVYGFIDLEDLPAQFTFSAFQEQSQLYILDAESGDFLMDTWHDGLGNMYDSDLTSRKMKNGTSFEQAQEDMANGDLGYIVFVSATTGDTFYSCYAPVGAYNLYFQVTVPRKTAFLDAIRANRVMVLSCAIQIFVILILAGIFLHHMYRQNRDDRKSLYLNRVVGQMQRKLFGAYKDRYFINEALQELKESLHAEQVMVEVVDHNVIESIYSIPVLSDDEKKPLIGLSFDKEFLALMQENIKQRYLVFADKNADILRKFEQLFALKEHSVHNLVLIWRLNEHKEIVGMTHAYNVRNPEDARVTLQMVVNSFLLAIQSCDSYALLKQMGTKDSLTGLNNRNSYQQHLRDYEDQTSVCYVYIDVNGLHEMNNNFGHEAGDVMLQTVANQIVETFGAEQAYRIGGDEFVVFCTDADADGVRARIDIIKKRLEEQEYHISAGYAVCEGEKLQGQAIAEAEQMMYQDKKAYYSTHNRRSGTREHNRKLEKILMEKKDMESFLSAISANFFGVYVVNLDTDDTRCILKPEYFSEILEENNYYFRSSLRQYAKYYISEKEFAGFMKLLDYDYITRKLETDGLVENSYYKMGDTHVRVRVMCADDYSENQRNVLWIFEKDAENEDALPKA